MTYSFGWTVIARMAGALGTLMVLAGCEEQPSAVLGTWTDGRQVLVFGADGGLRVRQTATAGDTGATWKAYAKSIAVTVDGQETNCGVVSERPSYMVLTRANTIGQPNCGYAGVYWRVDLPDGASDGVAAYSCDVTPGTHGRLSYETPFIVEADQKAGVICFGRTPEGCKVVGIGQAYPGNVSLTRTYSRSYGESYGVETLSGKLRLTLARSNQCSDGGNLPSSCSFSGYIDLGACTAKS